MSMLSTQCDNLRLMARLVREYDYSEISRMLREAADNIETLREKAQAATLGNGTLTAEQVRECVERVYLEGYSDGSVNRGAHIEETDWQAIANDLNAKLESGTCHGNGYENDGDFRCSECGFMVHTDELFNYCPGCRRKVVSE